MDAFFDLEKSTFLPGETGEYTGAAKSLLILSGHEKILVDTGIGNLPKLPKYRELRKSLAIHRDDGQGIKSQLARHGLAPGQINVVINTHLHTAHSGNNTLFKNAQFYVSSHELRAVDDLASTDPNQMSYVQENFAAEKDQITVKGEYKLTPDVTILPTPGHTMGHQSVIVDYGEYKLVYSGDVSPLKENFIRKIPMSSVDPKKTMESMMKLRKIRHAKWIFSHDTNQLTLQKAYRVN